MLRSFGSSLGVWMYCSALTRAPFAKLKDHEPPRPRRERRPALGLRGPRVDELVLLAQLVQERLYELLVGNPLGRDFPLGPSHRLPGPTIGQPSRRKNSDASSTEGFANLPKNRGQGNSAFNFPDAKLYFQGY